MDDVITRAEHEEFKKRIEDENHRQNKRIEVLVKITQQINSLTVSVEKLAQSIELMVGDWKLWKAEMGKCGEKYVAMLYQRQ